jgi:hypothetical protein
MPFELPSVLALSRSSSFQRKVQRAHMAVKMPQQYALLHFH